MTATFFEYLGWVSLSPNLKESFNKTLVDAEKHRHATVEIEHLLYALVDDPEGAIALIAMGVDRDQLRDELADHLDEIPTGARIELSRLQPARELKKLMAKASDMADNEHDDHIDGGDVVRALGEFDRLGDFNFSHHFTRQSDSKSASPRASRPRSPRKAAHKTLTQPPVVRAENQTTAAPATEIPQTIPLQPAPLQPEPMQPAPALAQVGPSSPLPPQAGDETVEKTFPPQTAPELNFDVDPIKASIKAIMARRADAEEILYECEWYHLFKSLNMIDEGLEGEAQTHRAKLLAKAERELAERPRCRKAFLYVRHLDQELARLKGIVDIDWAGDITPDETVRELSRMRALPKEEKISLHPVSNGSGRNRIGDQFFDVKLQESEVLALEQKLARLDRTAGVSQDRLLELEEHLQSHDTHSKKRDNIIGELESYLRSEMQLSDARDLRIVELEKELAATKSITDSQVGKTSHLENELAAFKEHAGNRELLISELETSLRKEKGSATSHAEQVRELRTMLANEKDRATAHDQQIVALQKTYEDEKRRAAEHERQVKTLEEDLQSRLQQLKIREDQIRSLEDSLSTREKIKEQQIKELEEKLRARELEKERQIIELQKSLTDKETHVAQQKEQLQTLQADLSSHTHKGDQHQYELNALHVNHKQEVNKLLTNIQDHESNSQRHQQEVNVLRAQLTSLEGKLQEQETSYFVEKGSLANTIEQLRQEIEESESLIEIIHATGEPYRIRPDLDNADDSLVKIVSRRTIPIPAKPQ